MNNLWILALHVLVIAAAVGSVVLVEFCLRQLSRLPQTAEERRLFSRGKECIPTECLCDMPGRTTRWQSVGQVLRWQSSV